MTKPDHGAKASSSSVADPIGRPWPFPLVRDFSLILVLGVIVFLIYSNTLERPFHFRINPDKAEIHYRLGAALYEQGRIEEANGHYFEALCIKPDFEEVHYNLETMLNGHGKTQEAIGHYSEAFRVKPEYAEAHNNLGVVFAGLGKTEKAASHEK
jgi:tetratricopeptide (TPR) repeat protein